MDTNVTSQNKNSDELKQNNNDSGLANLTNIDDKVIREDSFVADINALKMPLFLYTNFKQELDADGNPKAIEERRYKWTDSRGCKRELYTYCKGRLPRQFESDTLHGLLGLFVKKHGPFPYDKESGKYKIDVNSLEFSWYELCAFMDIPFTGYYIKRLKEAIRIIKQTQYFSYENGALYDKINNQYIVSGEEGLSLITKYKFKAVKKVFTNEYSDTINSNYVVFDELILNNLRYEYFKYLDVDLYFRKIPSGIGRGIYGYLESNRYDSKNKTLKYIKRSYDVLKVGIPLDFNYVSEMKRKVKKPLNHLKDLKDWAFGDEIKINGVSENCIYFAFEMTMPAIKKVLENTKEIAKQVELDFSYEEDEIKKEPYLKMPSENLVEELVKRKVDRAFAEDIVRKKDKWDIITYILWTDKQAYQNKNITDTGALLGFALRRDEQYKIKLSNAYKDILTFVEREKNKSESEYNEKSSELSKAYKEYVSEEVSKFKNSPEYEAIKEVILEFQNNNIESLIKFAKISDKDVSKYEEFKEKQENSQYFNDFLTKEVKLIKNIPSESEYILKNINKNEA